MSDLRPIRVAYLDPPYLGHGKDYSIPGTPEFHPDAMKWDDPQEHARLMRETHEEFPDGWALATNEAGVRAFSHLAPEGARLAPWVTSSTGALKMFRVAFAHEYVIYFTPFLARSHAHGRPSQLDWVAAGKGHNSDVEGHFLGAKPRRYCFWLFRLLGLGAHPDDELVDTFPGSGAVTRAWQEYMSRGVVSRKGDRQAALFEGSS